MLAETAKIRKICIEYTIYMSFHFVFLFVSNLFSGGKDTYFTNTNE
jgi:hypothetical protein